MAIPNLTAAVSSLQVSQQALQVIGNNLANANTEGYHRQTSQLANRVPLQVGNLSFGRGVNFVDIRQIRSEVLESSVTRQNADSGELDSSLRVLTRIESRISVESSSPLTRIEGLFNELEQLSTRLEDSALRNAAGTEALSLTDEFNRLADDLSQLQLDVDAEIRGQADEVNALTTQISKLNVEIARSVNSGFTPADLQDLRGQAINDLAKLIDVRVQAGNAGQSTVIASNTVLAISAESVTVRASLEPGADAAIVVDATGTIMPLSGGELTGLIEVRNGILNDVRSRLDELANGLISEFDKLHTEGVGTSGGFARLDSQRSVSSIDVPLAESGLDFPPVSGDLYIGVTDTSTGERTLIALPPIDPGSLTLRQLAANITNATPNVSAVADDQTGGLTILAEPGFEFEFTGGTDDSPTRSITNSPPLSIGGAYGSGTTETLTFAFNGTGTVGTDVTGAGSLTLDVTDPSTGSTTTFDIGSAYTPGQELTVNGLSLRLGSGGVTNGATFNAAVAPGVATSLTNSAPVSLGGAFTGDTNGTLTFVFNGSGTVGLTDGLELVVTNESGANVATLNIGSGYAAGTELDVIDGITVTVDAGDAANGEAFVSDVVGDPDTSNILRGLGLNTFFTGSDASNISVNQTILNDSGRIATSRTREASDSSNLQRLVAVRESRVFASATQDVREFSTELIADVALEVRTTTDLKETADTLSERLEEERQSVSGVDPNEELVELIKFQRQFEIAARFLSTVNQTLDDLLRVI